MDNMNLEQFRLWSDEALRVFLSLRGKSVAGNSDELACRAFVTWEEGVNVDTTREHNERQLLNDYKAKLKVHDAVLPDPFTLQNWKSEQEAVEQWPQMYFCDVTDYLQERGQGDLYHRLRNEYKEGKAYRYYSSGWVKSVEYHPISDASKVCFFRADVTPTMSIKKKPYKVWAAIIKDGTGSDMSPGGQIVSAYCTCTAGLLGTCNHVVGMLFRIEAIVRLGTNKPSCTSKPSVWNVPSSSVTLPTVPVEELHWGKDHYRKQFASNKEDAAKDRCRVKLEFSTTSKSGEATLKTDKIFEDLKQLAHHYAPDSCISKLTSERAPAAATTVPLNIPTVPALVAHVVGRNIDRFTDSILSDVVHELRTEMNLCDNQICALEQATIKQSEVALWQEHRIGRITASNFGRVYKWMTNSGKKPDADPSKLLHSLLHPLEHPTAAMKHGISCEFFAKEQYLAIQKELHSRFEVRDSGLIIFKQAPHIGASPDLRVNCACHGEGLCEIKCPFKIKGEKPSHQNLEYIKLNGHLEQLDKNSNYYFQVQGQMGVAQTSYCDFFVYTGNGHFMERIIFDPILFDALLSNISQFWLTIMAPSIVRTGFNEHMVSTDAAGQSACNLGAGHKRVEVFRVTFANKVQTGKKRIKPAKNSQGIKGKEVKGMIGKRPRLSKTHKGVLSDARPIADVFLCGMCAKDVVSEPKSSAEQSVECDICHVWFHFGCVGYVDNQSSNVDCWACTRCSLNTPVQ